MARRSTWNTYATYGFSYDVANDQASAGGIHEHQVRLSVEGWQKRILQANGRHTAYGSVIPISAESGEAFYAIVQQQEQG